MSEFKWLVNPGDKEFLFQHNGTQYVVPAKSRKLLMSEVADHGAKRSYSLTDPVIDESGAILKTGNDVIQKCFAQEADVVDPVEYHEPILIEKSKDKATDVYNLSVTPKNPLMVPKKKANNEKNADIA